MTSTVAFTYALVGDLGDSCPTIIDITYVSICLCQTLTNSR
jgi:hypothetical protein